MAAESEFRRLLVSLLKPHCFVQPIESGLTGCGIPDVYVCTQDASAWLELKVISMRESMALNTLTVPFRPGQLSWLKQHTEHGGVSVLGIKLWLNPDEVTQHGKCSYIFVVSDDIHHAYTDVYDLQAHAALIASSLVAKDILKCLSKARVLLSAQS